MARRRRRSRASNKASQAFRISMTPQSQDVIPEDLRPGTQSDNLPDAYIEQRQLERQRGQSPRQQGNTTPFSGPPPLSSPDPVTRTRDGLIRGTINTYFGAVEGANRGIVSNDRPGEPRPPSGSVTVQPAPGVNPRFEGGPDVFQQSQGMDFGFNESFDQLDEIENAQPLNRVLNRGGVWYWHPSR